MPTIVATQNAANANSFLTLAEGQAYWDTRLFVDIWDDSEDQSAALILATRTLIAALAPRREFVRPSKGEDGYFIIHPTWTGSPATTTQALPWGRISMLDRNGNAILPTIIPQELKDATAELAGQMSKADRMLDSETATKGITSIKAGSVALTYKDDLIMSKVLPDVVLQMLPPSWLTEMVIEGMYRAELDVL